MAQLSRSPARLRRPALVAVVFLVAGSLAAVSPAVATTTTNESAPVFRQRIGVAGTGLPTPGDVVEPWDVDVAPNGDVYVVDSYTNRVMKYAADGAFLDSWGNLIAGSGPGEMSRPRGVAVAPSGDVYVLDSGNFRVHRFTPGGDHVSSWTIAGSGIDVGPDGRVWVTDGCDIYRYTATGSGAGHWLGGEPCSSAYRGISVAPDGSVFATRQGAGDLVHLAADGSTLEVIGGPGSGDSQFDAPWGVDVAPDGSVYVADRRNERIQHFNADGDFLGKWGTQGTGDMQFMEVTGVAVAPGGEVYTVDRDDPRDSASAHAVQRFTATGTFIQHWTAARSDGRGQFSSPDDLAAAPGGGLVVADTGNHRILTAGPDLVFDTAIGAPGSEPGQFAFPESVAVSDGGNIYVADTGNHRVQRFNSAGAFLGQWGSLGWGPDELSSPSGIDVDDSGDVWVTDAGNDRIQRFSADGDLEASIGSSGGSAGQFEAPTAIAVSDEGVFVADSGNKRVQRLAIDGTFVAEWTVPGLVSLRAIAVDPRSGVWVSGVTTSGRSWRFAADGTLLSTMTRGTDGLDVGSEGHLYLTNGSQLEEWVPATGALMAVTLTAASDEVLVGQAVDYSVVVRNTGAVPLTGLEASFSEAPECDRPLPDVAAGETITIPEVCSHLAVVSDAPTLDNRVSVTSAEIPSPVDSAAGSALVAVTYPSPVALGQLGGPGTAPGELQSAVDLDVGFDGEVYVANQASVSAHEVDVFEAGQHDRTVALGGGPTQRLAVGVGGDIFQMDDIGMDYPCCDGSSLHTLDGAIVRRYAASGQPLANVGGGPSFSPGDDIAARADGHLLLAVHDQQFSWYDSHGNGPFLETAGVDRVYDIDVAAGTAVSSSEHPPTALASNGTVSYLLYGWAGGGEVERLGEGGEDFDVVGGSPASDLDADAFGNVFVVYPGAGEVRVFSPSGALLSHWATAGDRISVGPDGLVYVLDRAASVVRVYGFGITGVVADEVTDAPLAGVVAVAVDALGHLAGTAVSDASGGYRLRVGPGQYRVAFVDPSGNHVGEWAWAQPLSEPTGGASISVGVTGATVNIGLLPGRGAVAGTVTADGGGVVPGAWVAAVDLSTGVVRGAVAAGDGSYALGGLAATDHLVAFVDPSGQRRFEFFDEELFADTAEPVVVTAGSSTTASAGLAAQGPLASGSTFNGTVTSDEGGGPLAGAWVVAIRADGVMRAGAVTNASGQYSMEVGLGSYRLQVIDPGGDHTSEWANDVSVDDYDGAEVFTVGVGETETVDVALASSRGSIAGSVTDPTGPAAGAQVVAISLTHGGVAGAATVAGNGAYAIGGLLPGSYLVAFLDPWGEYGFEYHDNVANPAEATPVAVTAGNTTDVDAALG